MERQMFKRIGTRFSAVAIGCSVAIAAGCETGPTNDTGPATAEARASADNDNGRPLVGQTADLPAPQESPIHDLRLLTSPTALNIREDQPGPDGFAANVYAMERGSARPGAIQQGTLEVVLFEGVVRQSEVAEREPREVWRFSADELATLQQDTAVGVTYGFTFVWDRTEPFEKDEVTVLARYLPSPDHPAAVYSAPVTIALRAR